MFEFLRMFQGLRFSESFKDFQDSFKRVSRVFQERLNSVLRNFQGNFKGVSSKIDGCFK